MHNFILLSIVCCQITWWNSTLSAFPDNNSGCSSADISSRMTHWTGQGCASRWFSVKIQCVLPCEEIALSSNEAKQDACHQENLSMELDSQPTVSSLFIAALWFDHAGHCLPKRVFMSFNLVLMKTLTTFSGNNRTTISHSSHGDSMEIHLLHKIVYGLLMLLFACLCCFTEKFAFILPKMDSQQAEHCMHTRMALTIDSLQCPPWSSVKRPWEPYIDLKLFTMVVTFVLCYLLFHLAKQSLISGIYLAWWMLYRISIIQSS